MNDLWAIAGIIIVAVAYEVDHKIGLLLFFIVVLVMAFTIQRKRGIGFEAAVPPTVQ